MDQPEPNDFNQLFIYMGNLEARWLSQDNRQRIPNLYPPYTGIGQIISKFIHPKTGKVQQKRGMAAIISENLLLSCTHNLIEIEKGKITLAQQVVFIPSFIRGKPNKKKQSIPVKYHFNHEFFSQVSEKPQKFDLSILQMIDSKGKIDGSQVIRVRFDYDFKSDPDPLIQIAGFPYSNSKLDSNILHFQRLKSVQRSENFIKYQHTTQAGYSGGPVLVLQKDGIYSIIGVHKGASDNLSKRFNYGLLLKSLKGQEHILSPLIEKYHLEQKFKQIYKPTLQNFKNTENAYITQMHNLSNQIEEQDKRYYKALIQIKKLKQDFQIVNQQKSKALVQIISLTQKLQSIKIQNNELNNKLKIEKYNEVINPQKQEHSFMQRVLNKSSIFTQVEELQTLRSFFNYKIRKIYLIFKASENNFNLKTFYQNCGDVQDILIIAKTNMNKVLGGYSPLKLKASLNQQQDFKFIKQKYKKSFIFSLSNNHKFALKNSTKAICRFKDQSYIYFGQSEFRICDQANVKDDCCSYINKSYQNQNYNNKSYKQLNGNDSQNFTVRQWEAWKVVLNEP